MCTLCPVRLSQSIECFLRASATVLAHVVFAAIADETTVATFLSVEVVLVNDEVEFADSEEVPISSSGESDDIVE